MQNGPSYTELVKDLWVRIDGQIRQVQQIFYQVIK